MKNILRILANLFHRLRPVSADEHYLAQAVDAYDLLGSNGKAMTATMVARLVERGVLSWDAPLSQTLPELATDMQAAYREVTLRDLLAHQSGMQPDRCAAGLG
jgi:CubicO group peptidase (beta-lactamase class C family)